MDRDPLLAALARTASRPAARRAGCRRRRRSATASCERLAHLRAGGVEAARRVDRIAGVERRRERRHGGAAARWTPGWSARARRSGGTAARRASRGRRAGPTARAPGTPRPGRSSLHIATSSSRHSSPAYWRLLKTASWSSRSVKPPAPSISLLLDDLQPEPRAQRPRRALVADHAAEALQRLLRVRQPVRVVAVGDVVVAQQRRQVRRAEDAGLDRVRVGVPARTPCASRRAPARAAPGRWPRPAGRCRRRSSRWRRWGSSRCRRSRPCRSESAAIVLTHGMPR